MSLTEFLKDRLTDSQRKRVRNALNYFKSLGKSNDLTKLAKIYRSDKWGWHSYTMHYTNHFRKFKYKRIRLLEIGVGGYDNPLSGGESLRMWKRYFPNGKIFSVDIYDKSLLQESRIKIFKGSQADEAFMHDVVKDAGPFDLIIDDGSHENQHVIASFKTLFPALNEGGIYVVEDTQTSYWKEFGGDSDNLSNPDTIMNFFKKLADGLNYKELIRPGYQPAYFDQNVMSVHFYHNLIFIYKGRNIEESNLIKNNQRPDTSLKV